VGGLLALFLGASVITCLELLHVVARRCLSVCTGHRPAQHRKRCRRKSNPQHCADANHVHFRSVDDVTTDTLPVRCAHASHTNFRSSDDVATNTLPVRCTDANHVHFRSVDDVTADTLPVANHADARRSALKTPSPLQVTNVSPCSGRLVNTNTSSTQRSSLNNRSLLRPSPLAETDI